MLEILDPGLLATIQDGGRPGYEDLGVPRSGACDRRGLAVANLIHGNQADLPTLEATLGGLTLRALETCTLGLGGADLGATLDGHRPLRPGLVHLIPVGSTISLRGGRSGARSYLSLAGGIVAPRVLGSAATYLPGGLGWLGGRALAAGDLLIPGRRGDLRATGYRWPEDAATVTDPEAPLAVVPGPDADRFDPGAIEALEGATWTVGPDSDRMGIRLAGPRIPRRDTDDGLSVGMVDGAIQVPADGGPILLLADHQTVGGYPVVAVVASVDLSRAAQLRPGDQLRFEAIDAAEAQRRLRAADAAFRRSAAAVAAEAVWDALPFDAGA